MSVKQGWMDKQGMKFPRTWKTRYFFLNGTNASDAVLTYYTAEHGAEGDATAKEKKGSVSLRDAKLSPVMLKNGTRIPSSTTHSHGFSLTIGQKVLNLNAQSAAERDSWMAELAKIVGAVRASFSGAEGGDSALEAAEGAVSAAKALARGLVSKKKVRFVDEDFDLDLTYIDDERRIIAMGYPSIGVEATYRNPMGEVQRFFEHYHPGHYLIVNLCSERAYDAAKFGGHVECHPFDDHNACPLSVIYPFCAAAAKHLAADPANVVAIHCKAGKGRTGLMVAALLCHLKVYEGEGAAETALQHFGDRRTHNGKGVTIPSQMRYVGYYARCIAKGEHIRRGPKLKITSIDLTTAPNFDLGGGCDPYFKTLQYNPATGEMEKGCSMIKNLKRLERKLVHAMKGEPYTIECADFNDAIVQDDCKLVLYDKDLMATDDKMCHVWFNTAFVEREPGAMTASLTLAKSEIDKACKSKGDEIFPSNFGITIHFEVVEEAPSGSELPPLPTRPLPKRKASMHHMAAQKMEEDDDDDDIEIEGIEGLSRMGSISISKAERNTASWWFKRASSRSSSNCHHPPSFFSPPFLRHLLHLFSHTHTHSHTYTHTHTQACTLCSTQREEEKSMPRRQRWHSLS